MLEKIISGGQVGADIAGLRAAKRYGLRTGGNIGKNFRTKKGPRPELGVEYDLEEMPSDLYPVRTSANVRNSDATVRFALDFKSYGEQCTHKHLQIHGKPFFDIDLKDAELPLFEFVDWLITQDIEVLNVAGNANEDIELRVEAFLLEVFQRLEKYNAIRAVQVMRECYA